MVFGVCSSQGAAPVSALGSVAEPRAGLELPRAPFIAFQEKFPPPEGVGAQPRLPREWGNSRVFGEHSQGGIWDAGAGSGAGI